jgi:hypothetical protein
LDLVPTITLEQSSVALNGRLSAFSVREAAQVD